MSKGNPNPIPPLGKRNAAKGEVNLVPYTVRIDLATVALIKEIQALLGLKSQGETITKAINFYIATRNKTIKKSNIKEVAL